MNFNKIAIKFLLDNNSFFDILSVKLFSNKVATYIFKTICSYHSKYQKIPDINIIASAITKTLPEEKAKIYIAYLNSLTKIDTEKISAEEIIDGLTDSVIIKNVDDKIEELTAANFNKEPDKVRKILKELDNSLNISSTKPKSAKDIMYDKTSIKYIDSFLPTMRDNNTRFGGLSIVGGVTGGGKSILSYQQALYSYEQGLDVLLVSLEVPENEVMARLFACVNKVDFTEAMQDEEAVNTWKSTYFDRPNSFKIISTPLNADELIKLLETESKNGLDLAVVDYLQLVESSGYNDEWREIARLARRLHLVSLRLGIVILSPVQINLMDTKVDDNNIKITVRGSRELENSSNLFICLYADAEQYKDNVARLFTVKSRNSRKVTYVLTTEFQNMRFEDTGVVL